MSKLIQKALDGLIRTVYPEKLTCNLCGREVFFGEAFCPECVEKLEFITTRCDKCGRSSIKPVSVCSTCKTSLVDRARSVLNYSDDVIALITSLKYRGKRYLAKVFAEMMSAVYAENFFCPDMITYVPMTDRDEFERGYNQSEELAIELSKIVKAEVFDLLEKVKSTKNQVGLNYSERQKNLKGSFAIAKGAAVKGKKILVVDDVLTTGATGNEIATVLKGTGAKSVFLLTIASVPNVYERRDEE